MGHFLGHAVYPGWRYGLLSVDFFSGDRGSDLGQIKSSDVLTLPGGKVFIFSQVFGKTLGGNGKKCFRCESCCQLPFLPSL